MNEKKSRVRFSQEIRENAVRLVIDGGRKVAEVAAAQHLPVTSVYAWVKKARLAAAAIGPEGVNAVDLQQENARLRKELKLAKEHALFLRKTAAFFASEKK